MNWIGLIDDGQLQDVIAQSDKKAQVIFKHSTTCSISQMAKARLDRASVPSDLNFYYLDLLSYRSLSNKISEDFGVEHQSPQILVIKNGQCIYNESHSGINVDDILEAV
jgi:bacillithiol system protein YtxJ